MKHTIYNKTDIEKLTSDSFQEFRSGKEPFDNYIHSFWSNWSHGEVLYAYTHDNDEKILAYYSLMSSVIIIADDYAPAVEIVMFATDESMRGKVEDGETFGETILNNAIFQIAELSQKIGIRYIVVFSVNEETPLNLYERCGFRYFSENMGKRNNRFIEGCIPMYYDLEA